MSKKKDDNIKQLMDILNGTESNDFLLKELNLILNDEQDKLDKTVKRIIEEQTTTKERSVNKKNMLNYLKILSSLSKTSLNPENKPNYISNKRSLGNMLYSLNKSVFMNFFFKDIYDMLSGAIVIDGFKPKDDRLLPTFTIKASEVIGDAEGVVSNPKVNIEKKYGAYLDKKASLFKLKMEGLKNAINESDFEDINDVFKLFGFQFPSFINKIDEFTLKVKSQALIMSNNKEEYIIGNKDNVQNTQIKNILETFVININEDELFAMPIFGLEVLSIASDIFMENKDGISEIYKTKEFDDNKIYKNTIRLTKKFISILNTASSDFYNLTNVYKSAGTIFREFYYQLGKFQYEYIVPDNTDDINILGVNYKTKGNTKRFTTLLIPIEFSTEINHRWLTRKSFNVTNITSSLVSDYIDKIGRIENDYNSLNFEYGLLPMWRILKDILNKFQRVLDGFEKAKEGKKKLKKKL